MKIDQKGLLKAASLEAVLVAGCSIAAIACLALAFSACGSSNDQNTNLFNLDGGPIIVGSETCVGIGCQIATCGVGTKTRVTGTVFDPAAKNPLFNVIVYVPNGKLADISEGASCDRCGGSTSGNPLAVTLTDAAGHFVLEGVPSGTNIPLVMQVGKWRRQIVLPEVRACADNVADPTLTRLPRNQSEGHIPQIALTTGGADPLECLLRKVGLDDSEFTAAGGGGRVHLYAGGGYVAGGVAHKAASSFAAGAVFPDAQTLWNDVNKMKAYDVLLMGCEGSDNPSTKPTPANLYTYASAGGRVFASHWHEYWFSAGPPEVKSIGAWTDLRPDPTPQSGIEGTVDGSFPKGKALQDWLGNVKALTPSGKLLIKESKHNLDSVDAKKATSWIHVPNANVAGTPQVSQYVTFNAPVGAADDQVCGRVVFSDLHVSSGDAVGQPFPNGCASKDLSPQEKALEFMLFDLSSCVQNDSAPPIIPK